MGKGIFIGIIAVLSLVLIVAVAALIGIIDIPGFDFSIVGGGDDDPINPGGLNLSSAQFVDLHLTDRELHQMMSLLANSSPPFVQHQVFIDGLHMKAYGGDGTTAYAVFTEYETLNADDGFISYDYGVRHGVGWTAYSEIWYNDIGMGRAIIVGDGSTVSATYGHDVILITSYGPILDYYDYVTFLATH